MTNYIVQAGDNLTKIARAHGTTVEELKELNDINDVNKISIGQELSLGHTQESKAIQNTMTNDSARTYETKPQDMSGMDSFVKSEPEQKVEISPFLQGMAGGAAVLLAPKVLNVSKTAYTGVTNGTQKAYAKMQASAKSNAKAVRNFVTQKAKHAAKSAELHYAFGKDAVKKGASNVAQKAKHAAKSAELHYAFGKDAVKKGASNVAAKSKTVAKNVANKAKVAGRYTRFIGNTKVAPKLIKCAGKLAVPLAMLYGAYECKSAYDKGGTNAAVKQGIKTGGGLLAGYAGAKIGAAIGSFGGPIGTVVGGLIGGIGGYLLGEKFFS